MILLDGTGFLLPMAIIAIGTVICSVCFLSYILIKFIRGKIKQSQ